MLTEKEIIKISKSKNEPEWLLKHRLSSFEIFKKKKFPNWGPSLERLELDKIRYYLDPKVKQTDKWEELPREIKDIYDKLGIPKAEQLSLAGTGAQFESEVVYHRLKKKWEDLGVIFVDMSVAVKKYGDIVKKYFSKIVPISDHKFASLHYSVWSGGSFIYVPKGVHVNLPLQAYFRMNSLRMGQFEHTLIIVDEGSYLHYIEGCSAPQYSSSSLHAGCVELYVHKNSKLRYSSVENWSRNTFNLNTKRAIVEDNGIIEWVGGNLGSGATMLYPMSVLKGNNSSSSHISVAFAAKGQNQDVGAKVHIIGKNCNAIITSKSISIEGGISTYRGFIRVNKDAENAVISTQCDALMMDDISQSNTFPVMDINNNTATISHEASVGKISDDELYYLSSRGIPREKAVELIVSGFIDPVMKELPLEYASELNRLIQLEMEDSIG